MKKDYPAKESARLCSNHLPVWTSSRPLGKSIKSSPRPWPFRVLMDDRLIALDWAYRARRRYKVWVIVTTDIAIKYK